LSIVRRSPCRETNVNAHESSTSKINVHEREALPTQLGRCPPPPSDRADLLAELFELQHAGTETLELS
jgi:hypothetical protein